MKLDIFAFRIYRGFLQWNYLYCATESFWFTILLQYENSFYTIYNLLKPPLFSLCFALYLQDLFPIFSLCFSWEIVETALCILQALVLSDFWVFVHYATIFLPLWMQLRVVAAFSSPISLTFFFQLQYTSPLLLMTSLFGWNSSYQSSSLPPILSLFGTDTFSSPHPKCPLVLTLQMNILCHICFILELGDCSPCRNLRILLASSFFSWVPLFDSFANPCERSLRDL